MKTLIAVVAFVAAQTSGPVSPFEGHWKTNLPPTGERSSLGMAPSGLSFAVVGDTVKITQHWIYFRLRITALNEARQPEQVYQADGKPHPSPTRPNWIAVATWVRPDLLEIVETSQRPVTELVHTIYAISADRKTMTRRSVSSQATDEQIFYR